MSCISTYSTSGKSGPNHHHLHLHLCPPPHPATQIWITLNPFKLLKPCAINQPGNQIDLSCRLRSSTVPLSLASAAGAEIVPKRRLGLVAVLLNCSLCGLMASCYLPWNPHSLLIKGLQSDWACLQVVFHTFFKMHAPRVPVWFTSLVNSNDCLNTEEKKNNIGRAPSTSLKMCQEGNTTAVTAN